MLRSNSKRAIENIRQYILSNTEYSFWSEEDSPKEGDFKEVAKAIWDRFYDEKIKYDLRKNLSTWDYFEEWCQGLPSCLDTCYYYNRSAIEDLGNILEETEEERSKYTDEKACKWLTHLIFRELVVAVK